MTVRAFHEAAPLPVTARLGALLGAELTRVSGQHLPDDPAVRRLLSTARAFLLAGEQVALPGLGRLVPAAAALNDSSLTAEEGGGEIGWAWLAPDPDLHGQWPGSALEPVEPFSRSGGWRQDASPGDDEPGPDARPRY